MQDKYDNRVQVLDKSTKLIEKGWCRYQFSRRHHGKMHYCLFGAIHEATQGLPFERAVPLKRDLRDALEARIGKIGEDRPYRDLEAWNDRQAIPNLSLIHISEPTRPY